MVMGERLNCTSKELLDRTSETTRPLVSQKILDEIRQANTTDDPRLSGIVMVDKPEERQMRTDLLLAANEIICKDRAATHGKAENSFTTIANYWSVYLSNQLKREVILQPMDIAQMMVLFKIARTHNNPKHKDNWVDQTGYSALAGEMALK